MGKMTRTKIMQNNRCVGWFGESYKELMCLGEFMIGKKEISRSMTEKNNCRYITITVE